MIDLLKKFEGECACGRPHRFTVDVYSGKGVISKLPEYLSKFDFHKVYILCDGNTYTAAAERVCKILEEAGIGHYIYNFGASPLPNEEFIDAAIKNKPEECDILVSVGSGVINDIGKLVAKHYALPYVIVATAPSMDGYASTTSSVVLSGLKVSAPSKNADIIVGDTDILKDAPARMLVSGIGDMLAKYISICEWRISNLITGEYYCERIAELVRYSLKKCTENIEGLLTGDETAVSRAFDALTISSIAMNYAGISRPASGVEHYISHIIDMRNEEFGTPADLHGIQCGIATYICAKLYARLLTVTPDRDRALHHACEFSYEKRAEALRTLLGKGAESMIALEAKEGKFDKEKHAKRLDVILENFERIKDIVRAEVPSPEYLDTLFGKLSLERDYSYLGIDTDTVRSAFLYSGDIRDKYVLSRLAWDLGIEDELASLI